VEDFAAIAMVIAIIGQSPEDRTKKLTGGRRPGASGRNGRHSALEAAVPDGRTTKVQQGRACRFSACSRRISARL
jgi:hypothetical protein